jgi:DnaJ domain
MSAPEKDFDFENRWPLHSEELKQDVPDNPPPNRLLQVGVVIVIGAVAANVIGFRHSRWTVGKDLHRAWERRHAQASAQDATPKSQHPRSTRPSEYSPSSRFTTADRVFEEFMRQSQTFSSERGNERAWDKSGTAGRTEGSQSKTSSRTQRRPSRATTQRTTRFDFDASSLDDLLRHLHRGSPLQGSSFFYQGVSTTDTFRKLEELFRAAQRAKTSGQAQGGGFESSSGFEAEFWDEMFGSGFRQSQGSANRARPSAGDFSGRVPFQDKSWEVLGLRPGASSADVKSAYRRLAMKYHPDKYQGPDPDEGARRFRDVAAAYNVLKNES